MKMSDLRQVGENVHWEDSTLSNTGHGRIWKHRRKDGVLIDVEVTWTPIVFRNCFAALTMVTDITQRLRSEHHDEVFSKLSHRLSSATTASEAAKNIYEASDALFKWDDFALDLYSPEKDEVFILLNITTVDNRRVEIPSSALPKSENALIRRVIGKGAELVETSGPTGHSAAAMLMPIQKGTSVIGVLFIQSRLQGAYTQRDLETLQMLADQCSGALERVRAEEALRESQRQFHDLFRGFEGNRIGCESCRLHSAWVDTRTIDREKRLQ
jgi:K+-sensing histidine kinase KdpD